MRKTLLWAILLLNATTLLVAQELDCTVKVNSQKIANIEPSVFQNLEQRITDILTTTAWGRKKIEDKAKIPCSFILNIDQATGENTYQASLQVQASRLVFNSSYSTPLLNHRDKQISFRFIPNETLQFSKSGTNNNLIAVIAYYAYLIVGLDADSFSEQGGSRAFKNAQRIVAQQASKEEAWSSFQKKINRYWIIEDILNHKNFRKTLYAYHRKGLDKMVATPREGLKELMASIYALEKVYQKSPDAAVLHLFFDAKAQEVIESSSALSAKEKERLLKLLTKIDPGHLGIYKALE